MKKILVSIVLLTLVGSTTWYMMRPTPLDGDQFNELVEIGTMEKIKEAVENGANLKGSDICEESCLHIVLKRKKQKDLLAVMKYLIKAGAGVNAKDLSGVTVLAEAISSNVDILRPNLTLRNSISELLVKSGADLNAQDVDGITILDYFDEVNNVEKEDELLLRLLLDAGAKFSENNSISLIKSTFLDGNSSLLQYMLEKGANVKADKQDGSSLLWSVTTSELKTEKKLKLLKLLLDAGANPNIKDKDFGCTLVVAIAGIGCGEILQRELLMKLLIEHGADVNITSTDDGAIALHNACRYSGDSQLKVIDLVLLKTKNVDHRNKKGVTALMHAAQNGSTIIVKQLLKAGADVNAVSCDKDDKRTPLMWALAKIESPSDDLIQTLLESGADPGIKDKDGNTPISVAKDMEWTSVLKLLNAYKK